MAGCGNQAPAPTVAAPPPVKDHSAMMPLDGRVGVRTVPDHILDQAKLPGGTLADYHVKGAKCQLFIVDVDTDQAAAFLLLDMKGALRDPEYISYMGGYFGTASGGPLYVFSKSHYLAGVAGLSREKADPIARVLAARVK